MLGFVLLVLIAVLLMLTLSVGSFERCRHDIGSPLNFVLLQEPRRSYTDEIVSKWVKKPWKSNGERIPCHVSKAEGKSGSGASDHWILYAHGNACDLLGAIPWSKNLSHELNVNVLSFDYSGYGLNFYDAFERTADGINQTMRSVWDDLMATENPESVYLYGFSLGSGPTLKLACALQNGNGQLPEGVIVHGAFTSVLDVVKEHTHEKLAALFSERWNNVETMCKIQGPVLIMHSKDDTLISVQHAHKLRKANPNATFAQLSKGHSNFVWSESVDALKKFIKKPILKVEGE